MGPTWSSCRTTPASARPTNAGLERARHDVTVLLNPDCELIDGSLAALAALARAHPRALHAPRLLNADGTVQRSAHPLPGTVGALLPGARPPAAPPSLAARAGRAVSRPDRTHGRVGDRVPAWRRATATLRELGPFDPAVHLFAEDMELCLRARAAGIPTVLHPQLTVRHAGGHATAAWRRAARAARAPAARGGRLDARRRGRSRSTTSRRRSRSPPAPPATRCWAATPRGRGPSSPRCGGRGGSRCG